VEGPLSRSQDLTNDQTVDSHHKWERSLEFKWKMMITIQKRDGDTEFLRENSNRKKSWGRGERSTIIYKFTKIIEIVWSISEQGFTEKILRRSWCNVQREDLAWSDQVSAGPPPYWRWVFIYTELLMVNGYWRGFCTISMCGFVATTVIIGR